MTSWCQPNREVQYIDDLTTTSLSGSDDEVHFLRHPKVGKPTNYLQPHLHGAELFPISMCYLIFFAGKSGCNFEYPNSVDCCHPLTKQTWIHSVGLSCTFLLKTCHVYCGTLVDQPLFSTQCSVVACSLEALPEIHCKISLLLLTIADLRLTDNSYLWCLSNYFLLVFIVWCASILKSTEAVNTIRWMFFVDIFQISVFAISPLWSKRQELWTSGANHQSDVASLKKRNIFRLLMFNDFWYS